MWVYILLWHGTMQYPVIKCMCSCLLIHPLPLTCNIQLLNVYVFTCAYASSSSDIWNIATSSVSNVWAVQFLQEEGTEKSIQTITVHIALFIPEDPCNSQQNLIQLKLSLCAICLHNGATALVTHTCSYKQYFYVWLKKSDGILHHVKARQVGSQLYISTRFASGAGLTPKFFCHGGAY